MFGNDNRNIKKYYILIFIYLALTLFAGAMSGLTVGYLSIDDLVMELRLTTGTEEEKFYSRQVLPVLSNRHWVIVIFYFL